ncbi:NAD-dependent epimerase/dehydratase family protein [Andreprevotia chitinilytica]|uniref:NAD-dependent epimerase/dehydratase family protein n=1 Tax=Andreprevotia chitinilytica TaxID=396808 RepID=UPI000551AF89|nr:NAD-dependent epimerase/dehydratase family protein [Andreprevotia chitinilytica]
MSALKNTVMILGANGRIGRATTAAFAQAGWRVIAQTRTPARYALPAGAEPLVCDVLDTAALIAAGQNADVIVNAINPEYTQWEKHLPPITASVLQLAKSTRALLMLPGNVYNYGREMPSQLLETTPQVANTSKAKLRIALESQMQAAAAQGVNSVVIRAGDFLGGEGAGTWLDQIMAKGLKGGSVTYMGPMDVAHAWAYLPDLAEVFVKVAERRDQLSGFNAFNFEGHTLTGQQFHAALEQAVGQALRIKQMPWWLFRLISPVVPLLRALLEMRYLWNRPHQLVDTKLRGLIGSTPRTETAVALREALAAQGLLPAKVAAAQPV